MIQARYRGFENLLFSFPVDVILQRDDYIDSFSVEKSEFAECDVVIPSLDKSVILRNSLDVCAVIVKNCVKVHPHEYEEREGTFALISGIWVTCKYNYSCIDVFVSHLQCKYMTPYLWAVYACSTVITHNYILTPLYEAELAVYNLSVTRPTLTSIESCHAGDDWRCSPDVTYKNFIKLSAGKCNFDLFYDFKEYCKSYNGTPYIRKDDQTDVYHSLLACGVCSGRRGSNMKEKEYPCKRQAYNFNYCLSSISPDFYPVLGVKGCSPEVLAPSYGICFVKYVSDISLNVYLSKYNIGSSLCPCTFGEECTVCTMNTYAATYHNISMFDPKLVYGKSRYQYVVCEYGGVNYIYALAGVSSTVPPIKVIELNNSLLDLKLKSSLVISQLTRSLSSDLDYSVMKAEGLVENVVTSVLSQSQGRICRDAWACCDNYFRHNNTPFNSAKAFRSLLSISLVVRDLASYNTDGRLLSGFSKFKF
jgi:hypothetical protein